MRVEVHARHGSTPQYLIDHAEPRLERLDNFLSDIEYAKVTVAEQRGRFTVEITAHTPRHIFRSEKTAGDVLEAFDDAFRALELQVRRLKARLKKRSKVSIRHLEVSDDNPGEPDEEYTEESEEEPEIVRIKTHSLKPMSPQEAALQMEMVGHDFFVFTNAQTEKTAVVYRRKSGGYGLIEPAAEA